MWGYDGVSVILVDVYEQKEATEVFFSLTKLFQSKDIGLRRLVYLMIKDKEICPSSDEVIFAWNI